jgi:hypothetical protein
MNRTYISYFEDSDFTVKLYSLKHVFYPRLISVRLMPPGIINEITQTSLFSILEDSLMIGIS